MEQKTILTVLQRKFLELVLKESYLLKNYYWTGGTVLSEFYLHHRESYDIDLFTERLEVDLPIISKFVGIVGKGLGAKEISHTRYLGLQSFIITFKNNVKLKVDFNFYPFPRINLGKKWKGLDIDSLEDIAVNKIHTASMKPRARDFVDLYFLLQGKGGQEFTIGRLISLAKAKFDWHIEPVQLSENFAKVVTFTDFPKMLVPFKEKDMEKYFLKLAKSMKKMIFK